MKHIFIRNLTNPNVEPISADYCDSFWSRFMGLMFRKSIGTNEGIFLVGNQEDKINSAIHMLFMRFSITAVWMNEKDMVTDVKLALPWRLLYIPQFPSKSILEIHSDRLNDFKIGDQINITNA
jgi:uncharacterized protein